MSKHGHKLPHKPRKRRNRNPQAEPEPADEPGREAGLGGDRSNDEGDRPGTELPQEGNQGAAGRDSVLVPYHVGNSLRLVTGDHTNAHSLLCVLFEHFHQLDDLIDGDKQVTANDLMRVQLGLMHTLSFNDFWTEQKHILWPIIHTSIMAYWESEVLRKTTIPGNKIVGHVLKSQYQEIAYMVAFVIGGLEHEMKVRKALRYADFDD